MVKPGSLTVSVSVGSSVSQTCSLVPQAELLQADEDAPKTVSLMASKSREISWFDLRSAILLASLLQGRRKRFHTNRVDETIIHQPLARVCMMAALVVWSKDPGLDWARANSQETHEVAYQSGSSGLFR